MPKKVIASVVKQENAKEQRVFQLVESIRSNREAQASLKEEASKIAAQRKVLEAAEQELQDEIVSIWKKLDKPKSIREPGTTVIVNSIDDKYDPQSNWEEIDPEFVISEEKVTVKYSLNLEKVLEYVEKNKSTPKGIVAFLDRHKVTIKNQ